MKSSEWSRLARTHLLPALPGTWVVRSNHTTRLPTSHLAWVLTFQSRPGGFFLDALAMPMFIYSEVLVVDVTNRHLGGEQPHGHFFDHEHAARIVEAPDREFPALVQLVLDEALPHLQHVAGSVPAYLRQLETFAAARSSGRGTVHTEHTAAAASLLLGDVDSARTAYRNMLAEALPVRQPHPPWLRDLVRSAEQRLDLDDHALHAVCEDLLRVEEQMRLRWKLPESETPSRAAGLL